MIGNGSIDPDAMRDFGANVRFGTAADDYATHRAGFPRAFFDRLVDMGLGGGRALDIGAGTGTVARGLARAGATVTALDPDAALLAKAEKLATAEGLTVHHITGRAEALPFPDKSFDLAVAGQCWHWFDRPRAAAEVARVLRPGGALVVAHFDWLPMAGTLVAATEALILRYNPKWPGGGGTGLYPAWLADLAGAGLLDLRTFSFDVAQRYSADAWRGRIRASAGVAASLDADALAAFDRDLQALMARDFPNDMHHFAHRCWAALGTRAPGQIVWAGAAQPG
ncbi:MAG: class I SAM-dependent methyltransferase [Pseudomonadota bacterium]